MTKQEIENKIRKEATKFQIGGFKPDDSPLSSWIGKILVCEKGEKWPMSNGSPMIPICQINIKNSSIKADNLNDIELLTLYLDSEEIPMDSPNGDGWLIRTYKDLDKLVLAEQLDFKSPIKPFPIKPEILTDDFPCWEDCPIEIPKEFDDDYYDLFSNQAEFKIGGWPTLVQSEIYWAPFNEHPAKPEYVFQINSIEKANLFWGDDGIAYIGRGTKEEFKDEWTFSWQCY